jgi:hypothetical protein
VTRRRRKSTAASFGGAFGLLLVWVLLRAPWWLKILAVAVALVAAVGYVVVGRAGAPDDGTEHGADDEASASGVGDTTDPASSGGPPA